MKSFKFREHQIKKICKELKKIGYVLFVGSMILCFGVAVNIYCEVSSPLEPIVNKVLFWNSLLCFLFVTTGVIGDRVLERKLSKNSRKLCLKMDYSMYLI